MSTIKNGRNSLVRCLLSGFFLFTATEVVMAEPITPSVVTTQGGMPAHHYGMSADYMWHCFGAETCSPTQGPNYALFQQSFTVKKNLSYPQYYYGTGLPNPDDPFNDFALSVMADDYFAVYLNNHLLGWSWLNDGSSPNAPYFSDSPTNWTIGQLLPFFVDGTNVLSIFACDGRASDNLALGYEPGPTPSGGFSGCPNPSSYANNWLLVQGGFVQQDNTVGGRINAAARFVSGNESGNRPYATEFVVIPEPASGILILTGLLMGFCHGRRKGMQRAAPTRP